jgi:hypothetical protein
MRFCGSFASKPGNYFSGFLFFLVLLCPFWLWGSLVRCTCGGFLAVWSALKAQAIAPPLMNPGGVLFKVPKKIGGNFHGFKLERLCKGGRL